jgi:hypothetical protein
MTKRKGPPGDSRRAEGATASGPQLHTHLTPEQHRSAPYQLFPDLAPESFEALTPGAARRGVPGGLVVDPFLGSGTVAVAETQLGRSFAGSEIDHDTWHAARVRLAEEAAK